MAETVFGFGTPFEAQIAYLRAKLNLPTERWGDIEAAANDRAFVVTGAAKADLLADLHKSIVDRATDGKGLEAFRRDFKAIVAKHGWTGWTGEGSKEGVAWRTRVIYQTNMATSYAAGRYQQMTEPGYLRLRPFWRYIHDDSVIHPRELHQQWHGVTLPHDHPFWKIAFPPNGIGCHCRVTAVSAREGEASTRAGLGEPPDGWDKRDPKTGLFPGIDKGFDHAPGAATEWPLQRFIDQKLLKLDAPIGAEMWEVLKPALAKERLDAWQAAFDSARATMRPTNEALAVHTISPSEVKTLAQQGIELENAIVWMRDSELVHAIRDIKSDRGITLPDEVWRDLPLHLADAQAYLDTNKNNLVYAFDLGPRQGKVAIEVNYNEKGRFDGVRAKIVSNFVRTGGMLDLHNLREPHMKPLNGV